jgi:hypothetical protein
MNTLPDELLHLIFSQCPTPNLILTCKQWHKIILKKCSICKVCGKIIKMYYSTLWIEFDGDPICHGYYGTIEKYKILRDMLKMSPKFLQHINRQSLGLCYQAIKYNYRAIKFVHNITDLLICCVIKQNTKYLEHSISYTYTQYLKFAESNGECLQYIPKEFHTDKLYMVALEQNPKALRFVEDQAEKLCIYAIHHRLWKMKYMSYIKKFTEDIYVELYKSNTRSITLFKYEIDY